jgi:hypothetical protein
MGGGPTGLLLGPWGLTAGIPDSAAADQSVVLVRVRAKEFGKIGA